MTEHLSKLSDSIVEACKGYLARGLEPILARLKAVEEREPAKGDPGIDGKDADITQVAELLSAKVTESVKEIATSIRDDGAITKAVTDKVLKVLEDIPAPKDGTSVTVDDVRPLIQEEVTKAVGHIERVKGDPGADADPEAIAATVLEQVRKEMPAPVKGEPGADADPEFIREEVRKQVAEIKIPEPIKGDPGEKGADADMDVVKAMVTDLFNGVPKPQDGKSVTLDDVKGYLDEIVKKHVDAIPLPSNGEPGRDAEGIPGRDALQIEPIRVVDEERSYARGTWAFHADGMVRAYKATTPGPVTEENGWEVAVGGISEVEFELSADGRTIGVAAKHTNGKVTMKTFKTPFVVDRGVFDFDKAYDQGDGVTWGGSYWIKDATDVCLEPGLRGVDSGWRLAVKKGQNGKDLMPTTPAPAKTVRIGN